MCIELLLLACLLPFSAPAQTEPAVAGCEGLKNHVPVYIGGEQSASLSTQKYTIKKLRGRSIAGIPIPGGSGPEYQVQVTKNPPPTSVAESRPLFHLSSKTPAERIVAVRLKRCGKNDCFNLYEDGPASIALVRLELRELGPDCLEFHPGRPLTPGEYAIVILGADLKPEMVARFHSGPAMPEMPK